MHQDLNKPANLAQCPPKAADVLMRKHGHLLAQEPAENRNALQQSFSCPQQTSPFHFGGGRRPRVSARRKRGRVVKLIHPSLQPIHTQTAIGHHPAWNDAECRPALRTFIAPGHRLFLARAICVAPVRTMDMKLPRPLALRAIPRRTGSIRSLQRFLVNLHPPDSIPSPAMTASATPPGSTTGFSPTAQSPSLRRAGSRSSHNPDESRELPSRVQYENSDTRSPVIIAGRNTGDVARKVVVHIAVERGLLTNRDCCGRASGLF